MKKPRILIVANQSSVHTAGWLDMIADNGWDIAFFGIHQGLPHPDFRNVSFYHTLRYWHPGIMIKKVLGHDVKDVYAHYRARNVTFSSVSKMFCTPRLVTILSGLTKLFKKTTVPHFKPFHGPEYLVQLIERLKPDIIHSMDIQQAGYLVAAAKAQYKGVFPKWVATNWGSDLYYYGKKLDHIGPLKNVLQQLDYYACECARDVALARAMGMTKPALPVMPNAGGVDINVVKPLRDAVVPSKRKIIMVKGYQHFAGRALTALDAIERVAPQLKGYKVIVFSAFACPDVLARAEAIKKQGVIDIECLPMLPKAELLQYYARARIYLGVSISDAISTSLLESIAMGAFPIQTNTSCCEEWIKDGVSGFSIPPEPVSIIADRLEKALQDDDLVDKAAVDNWQVTLERLDKRVLKQKVFAFYETIMTDIEKSEKVAA